MMKRSIFKILLGLMLLVFMPACTADEMAKNTFGEASEGQTVISFAISTWDIYFYENMVEKFEEANPNIKVEFVMIEDVLGSHDALHLDRDGSLLKLAQAADVTVTDVMSESFSDLFIDLNPLLDRTPTIQRDDFYEGALDLYAINGGMHGIPSKLGHAMIVYNKDLFDAAGVEYPQLGWTWDDFLATAQALTEKSGSEVTQYGFSMDYSNPVSLISAKGGQVFNSSGPLPSANLTDPIVADGIKWVVSLATEYEVMPNPYDKKPKEESSDYEPHKSNGKDNAMFSDSIEVLDWLADENNLNLGVVPFPISAENDQTSPILRWSSKGLAISKGSAKVDAAWKWISFLLSQGSEQVASVWFFSFELPSSLPSRRSVAESTGFFDDFDAETVEAIKYAADHSFAPEQVYVGGEALHSTIRAAFEDGVDIDQTLAEGQKEFDEEVSKKANEEPTSVPEISVAEPSSSQISEDAQVVTFVSTGSDPVTYSGLAKAFNNANPEYFVKVSEPNFTDDFSLEGMVGDADCFELWSPITSQDWLERVISLQPLLDGDPDFSEEDLFRGALDQHRQNGQIMGIPSSVDLNLLSYSKKLHDEAGVAYPQPGWTLDDFLNNAIAIAEDGPEDTRVYGYVPTVWSTQELFTFLDIHGVDLMDETVDPPRANFNSPEFVATVRWYTDLVTQHKASVRFNVDMSDSFDPLDSQVFDNRQDIIDSGRAGMWVGNEGEVIIMGDDGSAESRDSDVGIVPYPAGPSGVSTLGNSGGFYISADTQSRQGCWEWIKYLSGTEASVGSSIPANVNAVNSPEFAQKMGAENAEMIIDILQNAKSNTRSFGGSWVGGSFEFLSTALNEIYDDGLTVEEALQGAQDQADGYRQCVIENDLIDEVDWREITNCLVKVDPNYDSGF